MLKMKDVLYREMLELKLSGDNIYVGDLNEINKECFNTSNLCIASLVYPIKCGTDVVWKKGDYKYVFQKVLFEDTVFYKELFSGAKLEQLSSNRYSKLHGLHVFEPISYESYVYDNVRHENGCLRRIKINK